MWVNKSLFQHVLDDNKRQADDLRIGTAEISKALATVSELRGQKVRDDVSIDWMRHRINALEKERAIMLMKVAGVALPVPEIVPTRPGTLSDLPQFDQMPSFEDVGDEEAVRLGVRHTGSGELEYTERK